MFRNIGQNDAAIEEPNPEVGQVGLLRLLGRIGEKCLSASTEPPQKFRIPHSAFRIPHSAFAAYPSLTTSPDWAAR